MRARVAVSFLLIAAAVLIPASPALAWTSSSIEDHALDPDAAVVNGRSAVAYVKDVAEPNADSVRYASLEDGVWKRSTVFANGVFFGSANPQVALESDGTPWVFFRETFPDSSLLYFRDDAGTWTAATDVPTSTTQDLRTLPGGKLALLYTTSEGLWYGVYTPGTDTLETEQISDKDVNVGSMRIWNGVPHVAFDANDGTLSHASRSGTEWTVQQVATSANVGSGFRPSLALGPNGGPRVAYTTGVGLHYAFRQAGQWIRARIHEISAINPSLRTAPSGLPQIAYVTGNFATAGPFALRFANSTSSGWILSVIFSSVGHPIRGGISLVTGTDGRSRIAYPGTSAVRWARP